MADEFKQGDKVEWDTPQGTTTGEVVAKVTGEKQIEGHTARASQDEPQYEVKSDKTGKHAVHKPEALRKTS